MVSVVVVEAEAVKASRRMPVTASVATVAATTTRLDKSTRPEPKED